MIPIDDGGFVFPQAASEWHEDVADYVALSKGGMTLRDYFAVHAREMTEQWYADYRTEGKTWFEADSAWRYAHADAMLAARK